MKTHFTFDDLLIEPKFSSIRSRKDVNLETRVNGLPYLSLPVISSNMDTVTSHEMAEAMADFGAGACLHRFMTIEDNVKAFNRCPLNTIVSIGVGETEFNRAIALFEANARYFCIDVANGASLAVAEQHDKLRKKYGDDVCIIVGNFGTLDSIKMFEYAITTTPPELYKVGIGPGSACTTRVKTGVGHGQLSAIMEIAPHYNIIADGGMRAPGDIAKALGAGAIAVMLGGMLAGTHETPGDIIVKDNNRYKKYRGSASEESYQVQGKTEDWRTAEGASFMVPYKGSVKIVLKDIEGGLRSALSYTNSKNLEEFRRNCTFIKVTNNVVNESKAHGVDNSK